MGKLGGDRRFFAVRLRFQDKCFAEIRFAPTTVSWENCLHGMSVNQYVQSLVTYCKCAGIDRVFVAGPPKAISQLWPQAVQALNDHETVVQSTTIDELEWGCDGGQGGIFAFCPGARDCCKSGCRDA